MDGITHAIALDAMLLQRFPEVKPGNEPPSQPHWRWVARACQLKRGVPCALMIEAKTGYLLLVSHLPESIVEFGFGTYDALLTSLDIHPDMHEQPYDCTAAKINRPPSDDILSCFFELGVIEMEAGNGENLV